MVHGVWYMGVGSCSSRGSLGGYHRWGVPWGGVPWGGQCTMVAGVVYHGYVGTTTWYYLPGWVGTTMGVVGGHGVCHGVGVGVPCGTWGGVVGVCHGYTHVVRGCVAWVVVWYMGSMRCTIGRYVPCGTWCGVCAWVGTSVCAWWYSRYLIGGRHKNSPM